LEKLNLGHTNYQSILTEILTYPIETDNSSHKLIIHLTKNLITAAQKGISSGEFEGILQTYSSSIKCGVR
jgi:hypothetical protein